MAFRFVVLAALVAAAQAGYIAQPAFSYGAQPAYGAPIAKYAVDADYDPNPQYNFAYDVQDSITGDSKSQHETRNGDVVEGSYSLVDADGYRRIVDYTADPQNGFNAVVRREPLGVNVAAPVAYGPAKYAAPLPYYH